MAAPVLSLCHPPAAPGQTFLDSPTTINYAIPGFVIIGVNNPDPFTVNLVAGGSVAEQVATNHTSAFNVYGGSTGGDVEGHDASTVNVYGGSIGSQLVSLGNSTVNIYAGRVATDMSAEQNGVLNVYGGSFGGDLVSATGATVVNLFGSDLALTDPVAVNDRRTDYTLMGTLEDGTSLDGKTAIAFNGGQIVLHDLPAAVPEPGRLAFLFGVAVPGGLWAWRRRTQRVR
jgi:hypothetical protein